MILYATKTVLRHCGKENRNWIVIVAVLAVVGSGSEALLLILLVSRFLGPSSSNQTGISLQALNSLSDLTLISLAVVTVVVLIGSHLLIARGIARMGASVLASSRDTVIGAFSRATWRKQSEETEGALQESAGMLATNSAMLTVHVVSYLGSALSLATLLAASAVISVEAALATIALGGLISLGFKPLARRTQRSSERFTTMTVGFNEKVGQFARLAMEMRLFGVDEVERLLLESESRTVSRALADAQVASRSASFLYRDVTLALLTIVAIVVSLVAPEQVPAIAAVGFLMLRCLAYSQQMQNSVHAIAEFSPNAELLEIRAGALQLREERFGDLPVPDWSSIHLKSVDYSYSHGSKSLDSIDVKIRRGESIGVIGPSGSGKSTLVQVLARLRKPTSGEVCLDGLNYLEVAPESWARCVAVVPQEPQLFAGTIRENIRFLRPNIDNDEIIKAAIQAHVYGEILEFPGGLDYELGPRGSGLSGGQRQRVGIARALAGSPELLILDEPTSALDTRSELLIAETLADLKGRTTLVIVAHRLSTASICSQVIAMEGGRMIMVGSLDAAVAAIASFQLDMDDCNPEEG
jgi:ATP-binding cassette subfamily B protein